MNKLTCLAICLIVISSMFGQGPLPPVPAKQDTEAKLPPDQAPSQTPVLTAADAEAFLDGLGQLQIERDNISGATIAITAQPANATIAAGSSATLSVTATLAGAPARQPEQD